MLHVYCGNDAIKIRESAFTAAGEREQAGATLTRIDSENYAQGMLGDALGAVSLFGGEEVFIIDTPSSNTDFAEEVSSNLEAMAESGNTFVVIEGALLAPAKKPYQKHAAVFEELKAVAEERFNVFAMADALLRKDKKSLWMLLQQARKAGLSAEEIIGTLWWQMKTLRLAEQTNSAAEAGLKDFPYRKAKSALPKFKDGDVTRISHALLAVYHDGHGGKRDINLSLEKWVLTL